MTTSRLFINEVKPNWCPGCGDYGLLSATTKVLAKKGFEPLNTVIVSGIGCSSSFPHWTTAFGIHMLHGRALPAAVGVKLINPELNVIVTGGDGDGYGIGVGHFVHTARRDIDLTYMVMNNQIYGLTLGQSSPSSQLGHITLTTPHGVTDPPINPIALAIGSGASFIARGFSGDNKHLQYIIEQALNHQGFAFIDVLSPCVTFNKLNTFNWFRDRVYKLEDEVNYDKTNISLAFEKSLQWGDKIPIGIFYQRDPIQNTNSSIPFNEPLGINHLNIDQQTIFDEFR